MPLNSGAVTPSFFFPGDVPYKPYISGEPEIRYVPLDGIEDFLIIACDGLWDYVDQRTAALRVYRQVLQNPCEYNVFSLGSIINKHTERMIFLKYKKICLDTDLKNNFIRSSK